MEYETTIQRTYDFIIITCTFTSDYDGEGTNALKRVLISLGIDEQTAMNYSRAEQGFKHTF